MFEFFKKKRRAEANLYLPYTTDLHSHILHGIDDGSPDLETSLALLRGMQELGLKRVIATPHIAFEIFPNTEKAILEAYEELRDAAQREKIDIELLYAAEHRLDELFIQRYKSDSLLRFSNEYCLIENSFVQPYPGLEQIIFELRSDGMQPVLAHPERYVYYHTHPEVFQRLQHLGCLFQVNILSFSGYYGNQIKEMSHWLLEHEMIQFVGTDLHHFKHLEMIKEYLRSKPYLKIEHKFEYLLNDSL